MTLFQRPLSHDDSFSDDDAPLLQANTAVIDNPEASGFGSTAATGRKNMLLLLQLRWIAVFGQIATITTVQFLIGIHLPLALLLIAPSILIAVNMGSIALLRRRTEVANAELFLALMIDIAALTGQLYLSGGITNPFVPLFLLQVVLGIVLLETRLTWLLVGITCLCFVFLTHFYVPLTVPITKSLFTLYLQGSLVCFALIAVLLVQFMTRILRNLRSLDKRIATLKQHAAEESLIVRMGWLASDAAHELGTPLSSLSVILNDWRQMPERMADPEQVEEIEEMQAAVQRCKSIVTGILLSTGEARGEALKITTVYAFIDELVDEWSRSRATDILTYRNGLTADIPIASDAVLKKLVFNVLDNAHEASPNWVELTAEYDKEMLLLRIRDHGPGFAPAILERFGKPYHSSKTKQGAGLGLFLVVNVVRKLGGYVSAVNPAQGGALVTLHLPLAVLSVGEQKHDG